MSARPKRKQSKVAEEKTSEEPSSSESSKKQKDVSLPDLKLDEAYAHLLPDTNQALGLAHFAIEFLEGRLGKGPDKAVLKRVELFHTDSVVCGLSAIALGANAPTILRDEALEYPLAKNKGGASVLGGGGSCVHPEKAIVANVAAVREWDSNGTVFGYNAKLKGHTAGEFGHNDFYPVVIAACQARGFDGHKAVLGMILIDEIRGRLAEVFSLKTYKIDHVVHGAVASAAVYGALMGATPEQIESAIGMVIAHYIPWRAIRAGHQLSDSKGASAAISTEVAILAVRRAMRGFVGPKDIFRNPESIFRFFQPTANGNSPFDLVLTHSGSDLAVMGMHFKLGLYEHQSAGALQGLIDVLRKHPHLIASASSSSSSAAADAMDEDQKAPSAAGDASNIKSIKIICYQPAFGIIGDPAKRDPHTRQSADHSMVFIVARMLRHALNLGADAVSKCDNDTLWKQLFLSPYDYSHEAIMSPDTRALMAKITFEHGGQAYDEKYPEGIPTSVVFVDSEGKEYSSGMVMFPAGHARNTEANLESILDNKFRKLGALAVGERGVEALLNKLNNLHLKTAKEIESLYGGFKIKLAEQVLE